MTSRAIAAFCVLLLGGASAAAAPVTARIVIHDNGFGFRDIGIRAPAARLTVVNRGSAPHALAVAPAGKPHRVLARTIRISPGQTTQITLQLPPGRYRLFSPLDHDRQHGLSVPLQVVAATGAGTEMNRIFYNYPLH